MDATGQSSLPCDHTWWQNRSSDRELGIRKDLGPFSSALAGLGQFRREEAHPLRSSLPPKPGKTRKWKTQVDALATAERDAPFSAKQPASPIRTRASLQIKPILPGPLPTHILCFNFCLPNKLPAVSSHCWFLQTKSWGPAVTGILPAVPRK